MQLLSPLSLIALLPLAGAIILLYLLRLRRRDLVIPSVFLWRRAVQDIQANAPFQKLRRNLLLFLQLAALACLVAGLAAPFFLASRLGGRSTVIVLDASASMKATDADGSRFAEARRRAQEIIDHIYNHYGGVLPATEQGYFRRAIADSSHRYGQEFDRGERVMVGVNKYVDDDHPPIPILVIDEKVERGQVARLKDLKRRRDQRRHQAALAKLRDVAAADENVMPVLIEAAEADATVGEMMNTLKDVYGAYDGGPEM